MQSERKYYREIICESREQFAASTLTASDKGQCAANSYAGTMHLSFDFAQKVQIPSLPYQPGPVFFLTPYKVGLFGIMNDTVNEQGTYVIPETVDVSKGANAVVSFLHHYLSNFTYGERLLHLHADNCVAQNKNNYVLGYFCWRVAMGFNHEIRFSFLPVGHTKFGPDWIFGLIKKLLKSVAVYCVDLLLTVISKASRVTFPVLVGNENNEVFVTTYTWDAFFAAKALRTLPKITTYSHFTFRNFDLGAVEVQHSFDGESERHILFDDILRLCEGFPDVILSQGLPAERQEYLYKEIRPFVKEEFQDVLCPQPLSSLLSDLIPTPVAGPSTAAPGPKKRGRPRKHDAQFEDEEAEMDAELAANSPLVKKARGRPRTHKRS